MPYTTFVEEYPDDPYDYFQRGAPPIDPGWKLTESTAADGVSLQIAGNTIIVTLPANVNEARLESQHIQLPAGKSDLVFRAKSNSIEDGQLTVSMGQGQDAASTYPSSALPEKGTRIPIPQNALSIELVATRSIANAEGAIELSGFWVVSDEFTAELSDQPRERFNHSITYILNQEGFREPQDLSPKKPNSLRIVAIGDSLTMGEGVLRKDTFCRKLETRLNRGKKTLLDGYSIEVLNLGVRGFNTAKEVGVLKKYIDVLDPDAVLLIACWNDNEDDPGHGQSQPADPEYENCRNEIRSLTAICKERGIAIGILAFRIDPTLGNIAKFVDSFASIASECRVPFVDLGPAIHRADWFWRFRANRADGHPNARAHEIAADSLYQMILDENLLDLQQDEPMPAH